MLSKNIVKDIIRLRGYGLSCMKIARILEIHPDRVFYVCRKSGLGRVFYKYIKELEKDRESVKGELEKGCPVFMD